MMSNAEVPSLRLSRLDNRYRLASAACLAAESLPLTKRTASGRRAAKHFSISRRVCRGLRGMLTAEQETATIANAACGPFGIATAIRALGQIRPAAMRRGPHRSDLQFPV